MSRERLLTSHRSGRFERWFRNGAFSEEDRALISALRVRADRAVLAGLVREGPSRFAGLRAASSLSPATLARSLQRLEEVGLIAALPDRRYALRDPEGTRMRLALYRQTFPDLLADAAREIFDDVG